MADPRNALADAFAKLGIKERAVEDCSPDEQLSLFIEVTRRKRVVEEFLKSSNRALADLERPLLEYFRREEKTQDKRRGYTVYMTTEVWPKVIDESVPVGEDPRVVLSERLAADPLTAHLVKPAFNYQTLRSWLNEQPSDPETLLPQVPEHLHGVLKADDRQRLKVRKSTAKAEKEQEIA